MNSEDRKSQSAPLWPLPLIYLLWCLFSFGGLRLGPLFAGGHPSPFAAPLSVVFFVLLASMATALFVVYQEPHLRERHRLRALLLSGNLAVGAGLFLLSRHGDVSPIASVFGSANLIVAAILLGSWMAAPLRRPAELVPVCLVMSLADLYSILKGPTARIVEGLENYYGGGMEGSPPVGDFLLVKMVVPGMASPLPVFGVADWVIVAFLAAAATKFGMNDNLGGRSLQAMTEERRISLYLPVAALGLLLAVLLAQGLGIFLPALPLVASVFLLFLFLRHPESRRLTGADWCLLLGFSSCMIALLLLPR